MIQSFINYNFINESRTLMDVKHESRGYGEIKKGFSSKGYKYMGTFFWENKYKSFYPDEISNILTSEMMKLSNIINDNKPNLYDLNINFTYDDDDDDDSKEYFDRLNVICNIKNIEKVISFTTKSGKLFYCFWNDVLKYYYFIHIKITPSTKDIRNTFIAWLNMKTNPESYINELKEKAEVINQKRKLEYEEIERKNIASKKYDKLVDLIEKDSEENEDKYIEVDRSRDLPQEIQDDLKKPKQERKYAEYVKTIKEDPYYYEDKLMVYINNNELNSGYKYRAISDRGRGHYWGD